MDILINNLIEKIERDASLDTRRDICNALLFIRDSSIKKSGQIEDLNYLAFTEKDLSLFDISFEQMTSVCEFLNRYELVIDEPVNYTSFPDMKCLFLREDAVSELNQILNLLQSGLAGKIKVVLSKTKETVVNVSTNQSIKISGHRFSMLFELLEVDSCKLKDISKKMGRKKDNSLLRREYEEINMRCSSELGLEHDLVVLPKKGKRDPSVAFNKDFYEVS